MSWIWRLLLTLGLIQALALRVTLCRSIHTDHGPRHQASHRRLRNARIKAIKEEILTKLGMTDAPSVRNVSVTVEEQRSKIKLFKKSLEDTYGQIHELFSQEEFLAKQFHSFSQSDVDHSRHRRHMKNRQSQDEALRLHFNVHIPQPSDPNKHVHVHSAKLKLYKFRVQPQNLRVNDAVALDSGVRVNVYQLLENPLHSRNANPGKRLVDSRIVSLREPGWEEFHLRETAQQWLDNPESNYGLEFSCDNYDLRSVVEFVHSAPSARDRLTDVNSRVVRAQVIAGVEQNDLMPSLDVYSQERLILGRQKRAEETHDCVQGDGESRCCRYPLWVSFKDIGWDKWIVAPEGYQAYYCDGDCPHRYKMAHAFAGVQALVNMVNPAAAPSPCCSATKLSPLSLLHYDEEGALVVSVYEDMIVQECKCS